MSNTVTGDEKIRTAEGQADDAADLAAILSGNREDARSGAQAASGRQHSPSPAPDPGVWDYLELADYAKPAQPHALGAAAAPRPADASGSEEDDDAPVRPSAAPDTRHAAAEGSAGGEAAAVETGSPDEAEGEVEDDAEDATALVCDGQSCCAVLAHSRAMEVPYGTFALWVRPADLDARRTLVAKAEKTQEGGNGLRIQADGAKLLLTLGCPETGGREQWITRNDVLSAGVWRHIAVTFDNTGTTVYLDGVPLDAEAWQSTSGARDDPGEMTDFSLEHNAQPIVLGADAPQGDLGQAARPFRGLIDGFALWGGFTPGAALGAEQIALLAEQGPHPLASAA